jgi:hypothetical protein
MTLTQMKAMFQPGQRWIGIRNDAGVKKETTRTVSEVRSTEIVWRLDDTPKYFSKLPKARDIIEARDGYLRYRVPRLGPPLEVELTREER